MVSRRLEAGQASQSNLEFGRLYRENYRSLIRFARKLLDWSGLPRDLDADLVQAASLVALERLSTYYGATGEEFRRWLKGILRNLVRKLRTREELRRQLFETSDAPPDLDLCGAIQDPRSGLAERLVELAEVRLILCSCLADMPAGVEFVVSQIHFGGMTVEKLAADERISLAAAKKRAQRAVSAFGEFLLTQHDRDSVW